MSSRGALLLQANALGFRYASRAESLFRDLDLALHAGSRIAIVGANGSGKTTLLRVLLGELAPTQGTLTRAPDGYAWVRQDETAEPDPDAEVRRTPPPATGSRPTRSSGTVLSNRPAHTSGARGALPSDAGPPSGAAWGTVLRSRPELAELHERIRGAEGSGVADPLAYSAALVRYEELGGYRLERRARAEADALGLDPGILERPVAGLSGGERRLAWLLGALLEPPAVLVLDEPTNFLDETAVAWLVDRVRDHSGGSLIVSHDRWFLDQVGTEVIELERGSALRGHGTHSDYVAAREADRRWRTREKARHEREIRELRRAAHGYGVWAGRKEREESGAFDKGFIGARAARLQKRAVALRDRALDQAEELERVKPWVGKRRDLAFEPVTGPDGTCTIARDLRVGTLVLPDLDVAWGERVAVVGRNGSGKTTLLRVLAGDLTPSAGHATWAAGARLGWFPQSLAPMDRTQEVAGLFAAAEQERARTLLGSLGVGAAEFASPLRALSEGQVRKALLARLVLDAPNVLLLDEPTTHLDVPSIELLESALAGYEGTVVLVTHDRYLRERVATRSVAVGAAAGAG